MALASELRTSSEKVFFAFAFIISLVVWLVVVVTIVGLVYGLLIGLFLFFAHALAIAHIKGNAVRVSKDQLPEIYKRVVDAARTLGLHTVPAAYVMQAGGALNAFATKFVGRNFIVIYSDLLDACSTEGRELDMIIGHEIGHLALGHLRWIWFLAPAHIFPWLGPAYSRAREYSCDLCGYEAAGEVEDASRGLAILAAGGKYGQQMSLDAFARQAADTRGFWASVYELNASHPFLPKRIAALMNRGKPGRVPTTGRHLLAYPLAPLFSMGSSPASAMLPMIAVIAILAAIAVPQFAKYREKALAHQKTSQNVMKQANPEQAAMDASLRDIYAAAGRQKEAAGTWPCSMDELQAPGIAETAAAKQWEIWVSCDDRYAAIAYRSDDQKHRYRAIYFDDGKILAGELKD